MDTVYQCVLVGEAWHLTQEQASPPAFLRGGAYTSCTIWAEFKRGYDKRRPTCPTCLRHVVRAEGARAPEPTVEVVEAPPEATTEVPSESPAPVGIDLMDLLDPGGAG